MKAKWLSMMRNQFEYKGKTYTVLEVLSIRDMDFVIYQTESLKYAYLKRNNIEERMTYSSFETLIKILPQYQKNAYQNIKNMLDAFVKVLTEKENMISLKRMFWEILERDSEYFEATTTQVLSFEYFETLFQTESYSYYGKNANKVHHIDASLLKEKEEKEGEKKFFTFPKLFYTASILLAVFFLNGFLGIFASKDDSKRIGDYLLLSKLERKPTENLKVVEKNYWKDITISIIDVDFTSLKKENQNIIGWFFLNGTERNFPIAQSDGKNKSSLGWLFTNKQSDFVNFKNNTFLYSEERLDFLLSEEAKKVMIESWYSKEENQLFVISTPIQNTVWKIVAIHYSAKENNELEKMYQDGTILRQGKVKSIYDFKETVTEEDKTLTLAIPLHSNGVKIVISAKMVQSKKTN